MEKRFSLNLRRILSLILVLALALGNFAMMEPMRASAADANVPFSVTIDKEGTQPLSLEATGELVETENYMDVPLFKCTVPADAEYVFFQLSSNQDLEDWGGYSLMDGASDTAVYKAWMTGYNNEPWTGFDHHYTVVCPFDAASGSSPKYCVYFEAAEASVETANVAFVHPDGTEIPVDSTNTLTVSLIDHGEIVNKDFTDMEGMVNSWEGQIRDQDSLIIGSTARKALVVQAGKTDIVMKGYDADWNSYEEGFHLNVLPSGITQLKAEIDGNEILPGSTYNWRHDLHQDGNYAPITLYGMVNGAWVKLPITSYNVSGTNGADPKGVYQEAAWRNSICPNRGITGQATVTVSMNEANGASMSFTLNVDVPPVSTAALEALMDEAQTMLDNPMIYDPAKVTELENALGAADILLTDPSITQNLVDPVARRLQTAIDEAKSIPVLYFESNDGEIILPDEENTFTLDSLIVGKFHVRDAQDIDWDCVEFIENEPVPGAKPVSYWNFWISEDGTYQPKGAKRMEASVTYTFNGEEIVDEFAIDTLSTGVTEIRVSVKDQHLTPDSHVAVDGREWISVAAEGLIDGEWVELPKQAFEIVPQYNIHTYEDRFRLWQTNQNFTIEVRMKENHDLKTSFIANACVVPLQNFTISAKTDWELDKLFFTDGRYVGVARADDPNRGYVLNVQPANATELDFVWTSSDPSIAEFEPLHSAGIVPKKAGSVQFTIASKTHPEIKQELRFNFTYKTPLDSVTAAESHYTMNVGDVTYAQIQAVPANATQQQFIWTYDNENVVSVRNKIELDKDGNSIFSYPITAIGAGEVTVTGTPVDDTHGCEPISFTVKVSSDADQIFTDVHENSWFRDDVSFVNNKGYMTGKAPDQFRPNDRLTRGELVTVLYRIAGEPKVEGNLPFTDVASNRFYSKPILWAYQAGIAGGMTPTEFWPEATATRGQLACFLYRFAQMNGSIPADASSIQSFNDAAKVPAFAVDAMSWAVENGVINGMPGNLLDPLGTATRAQFAATITRLHV